MSGKKKQDDSWALPISDEIQKKIDKKNKDFDDAQKWVREHRDALKQAAAEGKKYILYKKEGRFWRILSCRRFQIKQYKNRKRFVRFGELGGLIANESSLSQDGNCWVMYHSIVRGSATVSDNALICDELISFEGLPKGSVVKDKARVYDEGCVVGDCVISGEAQIYETAYVNCSHVCGKSRIHGNAYVHECSNVFEHSDIDGKVDVSLCLVYGYPRITDNAIARCSSIHGHAMIMENAKVYDSDVFEKAVVGGSAKLNGDVSLHGKAKVAGEAVVEKAEICGGATVADRAKISDGAKVCGKASIGLMATVKGGVTVTKDVFLEDVESAPKGYSIIKNQENVAF